MIKEENKRRQARFKGEYNQILGTGSVIPRREVYIEEFGTIHLPEEMFTFQWINYLVESRSIKKFAETYLQGDINENTKGTFISFLRLRTRCDFEFFCASCVKIKDKEKGIDVPFLLNYGQRKLLTLLESQRLEGKPIRVILLKARQWGGSTLTQIYMAWFQLFRRTGWHSVIAAHLSSSSANIKGMYSKLLENLPEWCSDTKLDFQPFERMQSTSIIKSRGNKVTIGSAESPNSIRGMDISMAHLSEVGFWADTPRKKATDLIRSITSPILPTPDTIIVMESTANGVGDYFHTEYIKAKDGNSDKQPLFVAWYEIEQYSLPLEEGEQAFYDTLSDYEQFLWNSGATLEAIKWYRIKRKEYHNDSDMMAEYPTNDVEAFALSGERVFNADQIDRLRANCIPPLKIGEITSTSSKKQSGEESLKDIEFVEHHRGRLKLWADREDSNVKNRYLVVVDVGGRSKKADFSVICVIDRYWLMYGGVPEVVAQWRGHIDHDLLVWKATQIATYYNNALLVIESNTLETDGTDGDHTEYILDQISDIYPNLYARTPADKIREGAPIRWGFHTNKATKTMIIDNMISLLRDEQYIERDQEACNEFDLYEKKDNGSWGAIDGHHDDILMTRLIGLYVAYTEDLPKEVSAKPIRQRKIVSEATI